MGILTDDMKRVGREQRLGYIATVCPDGTPNLSPKGTTTVWDDDHLVFADICSPGTLTNLAKNPSIEINVVDPVVRKGYRFKGSATILTRGAVFERVLPLISPIYDLGTSETEVAAKWVGYYGALRQGRASVRG